MDPRVDPAVEEVIATLVTKDNVNRVPPGLNYVFGHLADEAVREKWGFVCLLLMYGNLECLEALLLRFGQYVNWNSIIMPHPRRGSRPLEYCSMYFSAAIPALVRAGCRRDRVDACCAFRILVNEMWYTGYTPEDSLHQLRMDAVNALLQYGLISPREHLGLDAPEAVRALCDDYATQHLNCHRAVIALLGIRRFRNCLISIDRLLVRQLAQQVWQTRCNEVWSTPATKNRK